jgi:hypothetical protein
MRKYVFVLATLTFMAACSDNKAAKENDKKDAGENKEANKKEIPVYDLYQQDSVQVDNIKIPGFRFEFPKSWEKIDKPAAFMQPYLVRNVEGNNFINFTMFPMPANGESLQEQTAYLIAKQVKDEVSIGEVTTTTINAQEAFTAEGPTKKGNYTKVIIAKSSSPRFPLLIVIKASSKDYFIKNVGTIEKITKSVS